MNLEGSVDADGLIFTGVKQDDLPIQHR